MVRDRNSASRHRVSDPWLGMEGNSRRLIPQSVTCPNWFFDQCVLLFLFFFSPLVARRGGRENFLYASLICGTVQMFLMLSRYDYLLWVGGQRGGGEAATVGWGWKEEDGMQEGGRFSVFS